MLPMQPVITDESGVKRFRANALVSHLLDHGGIDMNALARIDAPREDREQFAQLIGYSLSGFSELSYVSNDAHAAAQEMSEGTVDERDARIKSLTDTLEQVRTHIRDAATAVFHIHPDDLHT